MGRLDIRQRIADDNAVCRGRSGKVAECLLKKTGGGFSACALSVIVRAEIEGVNVRGVASEMALELAVQCLNIIFTVETECDTALVADDQDGAPGAVQRGNGGLGGGKRMEVAPACDVLTLRRFAIDDSVAVEKNILYAIERLSRLIHE